MCVRIQRQLLNPVLTIRASAITFDDHSDFFLSFSNATVLMTYSHGNLNVHNLDCIQAFHMANESTARRLCAHLKHARSLQGPSVGARLVIVLEFSLYTLVMYLIIQPARLLSVGLIRHLSNKTTGGQCYRTIIWAEQDCTLLLFSMNETDNPKDFWAHLQNECNQCCIFFFQNTHCSCIVKPALVDRSTFIHRFKVTWPMESI